MRNFKNLNSGHGDNYTPKKKSPYVRSSFSQVSKNVSQEQQKVIIWSLLHIATLFCLVLGIFYGQEYMKMPDKVVIVDNAGNIYRGYSNNVICHKTVEDTAKRCAFAFLDRSYEHSYNQLCEALFGRTAQKSLQSIIRKSENEFTSQKIRQIPIIEKVEILPLKSTPGQCLAFVHGKLYRTGIYMRIPYSQKLNFSLGLRLIRSPKEKDFPLRVLRMTYEENSIYDNKINREDKKK